MDFLAEIIALKRQRLDQSRLALPLSILKNQALEQRKNLALHRFRKALSRPGINLIAEIKRSSPSLGLIRKEVNPANFAKLYQRGGAAAISVLTEEDRFLGSLQDLRDVRAEVSLPVLRKDFIFDEYQVFESAQSGADAVLLIVAALEDELLRNLIGIAEDELGMDALVEVHSHDELNRALEAGARVIGVNNRNLKTFEVSLETSMHLIRFVPNEIVAVAESGLRKAEDIEQLYRGGFRGFLVGETLMRSSDPVETIQHLLVPVERAET